MKYSGILLSEMKRLRELEDENNPLKKIVADLTPRKIVSQPFVSEPGKLDKILTVVG